MPTGEKDKYNYQFKNKPPEKMNTCYKEETKCVRNEDKTSCYNCKKEIEKLTSEVERTRLQLDNTKSELTSEVERARLELDNTKSELTSKVEKIEKVGAF